MKVNFEELLQQSGEFGFVRSIHHPIVEVVGLPDVHLNEVIAFENDTYGQVFILNENSVKALVFTKKPLKVGMKATRTMTFLSLPVGSELLGHIIDPFGNSIMSGKEFVRPSEMREVDVPPPPMSSRVRVEEPLLTGVSVIDLMVPLGKGQKELVIGDRKTGKTSFLLTVMKNQVQMGAIVIYAAVAKRASDIKRIHAFFEKERMSMNTVIIASTSMDSPALITITPYSAFALAEWFRDLGKEVVVVIDDLSTHARFYREIALLAKRFPGRDSYPGDIFHVHARLLERAGNFKVGDRSVSITALPVAETVEGDIAGYISTNLMGMTDGHIFFDSNIFNNGRRPAVNIPVSVTRVGRQTQSSLLRTVNHELSAFFAMYDKVQNLTHFGAELTGSVRETLDIGEAINMVLNQHYSQNIPISVQLVLISLLWTRKVVTVNPLTIEGLQQKLIEAEKNPLHKNLFNQVLACQNFEQLIEYINTHGEEFLSICKTEKG